MPPASWCIAASRCSRFIRRSFTARRRNSCWRVTPPPTIPARSELRETAANKLRFFDVSDAQIAEIGTNRGVARKTLPVAAPISGFVIEKNVVQGQMVDAGMRLYRIADLGIVWVLAQIYEQDLPFVQLGQEAVVKVASLPDREFRGRVTFIYPTVDEKTRTARVRLEFENPGYFLKPGMFVSAQIQAELAARRCWCRIRRCCAAARRTRCSWRWPAASSRRATVALGVEAEDGMMQVHQRIEGGRTHRHFGTIHAGFGKPVARGDRKDARPNDAGAKRNGRRQRRRTRPRRCAGHQPNRKARFMSVPMPEHVSIVYDHAGNCPICGMALVPVTPSA